MSCNYIYQRGERKGEVCGQIRCMHKFERYPIVYMDYISFPRFIRFYDGVTTFDKKYSNLYNNSCNNKYINKYHHIIPRWVVLYNILKIKLGGESNDIFFNIGNFIVSDYLRL